MSVTHFSLIGNWTSVSQHSGSLSFKIPSITAQTMEHTPAIIHGGPFANIAHGCNSVIATQTATKLADYVITEAGFGADLGAEKFLNIKMRSADLKPEAVVIVMSIIINISTLIHGD